VRVGIGPKRAPSVFCATGTSGCQRHWAVEAKVAPRVLLKACLALLQEVDGQARDRAVGRVAKVSHLELQRGTGLCQTGLRGHWPLAISAIALASPIGQVLARSVAMKMAWALGPGPCSGSRSVGVACLQVRTVCPEPIDRVCSMPDTDRQSRPPRRCKPLHLRRCQLHCGLHGHLPESISSRGGAIGETSLH
jgi:hypothetical protein